MSDRTSSRIFSRPAVIYTVVYSWAHPLLISRNSPDHQKIFCLVWSLEILYMVLIELLTIRGNRISLIISRWRLHKDKSKQNPKAGNTLSNSQLAGNLFKSKTRQEFPLKLQAIGQHITIVKKAGLIFVFYSHRFLFWGWPEWRGLEVSWTSGQKKMEASNRLEIKIRQEFPLNIFQSGPFVTCCKS